MISRISIIYLFLFLSKSFILAAERNSDEPKPVVIPIPAGRDLFADLTEISYNKRRKAYWLTTSHNVSIAVATAGKSQQLQTTGLTALQFGCDVGATNGGPFNLDGSNSGPAVIKGRKVQTEAPTDYVGFGTTCDGKYLFGNYYQLASSEQIWEFVTGFGWLVYDGSVVVGPSEDEKKAPRTIIGLDQDSNLISVVVDGCERCLYDRGMSLHEAAVFLKERGARYAISLDGGASSTMTSHYRIVNRPTCTGLPLVCERPVATTICISSQKQKLLVE